MIKTRATRILALAMVLIVPALFVKSAYADGAQKFKMRFAGGFIQNVEQAQVTDGVPNGITELRSLALVKGRGTFGRADIMAVSVSGPPVSVTACSAGLIKIADIVENNLVLTFADLSLLYGNGTGVVCLDPTNPTAFPLAEIKGTWDGGTGRFEGAEGKWTIRFDFAESVGSGVGPDTQFVAESGVIKGYLIRNREKD